MNSLIHRVNYHLRRLLSLRGKGPSATVSSAADDTPHGTSKMPRYKRYLSGRTGDTAAYLSAANDYVANKTSEEIAWLYCKPYERKAGNEAFYTEMYQVMNLLQAMEIPYGGRILEVGSGPGWVTEILVSLGYEVHGLEPSPAMVEIARKRVHAAMSHWRIEHPPEYEFCCQTLEECSLTDASYDAIFFHASLHHIIDEEAGFAQCYRLLKAGGVLGISEAAWEPGNRDLEAALDEEMARFGTLENPYTREYLDYLLTRHGFIDIQRYHSINGLIPVARGDARLASVVDAHARNTNNVTAIKEGLYRLTTRDHSADTRAGIRVLKTDIADDGARLHLQLTLTNRGETVWLHKARTAGWVSVAVRTEPLGGERFRELERTRLPRDVKPGEEITLVLDLALPEDYREADWYVDLVNEELFWFSTRGPGAASLDLSRQ